MPPVTTTVSRNKQLGQPTLKQFPLDLGNIRIGFKFIPYSYSSTQNTEEFTGGAADIILPIPQNLEDIYRINVGETQLGAIGATVLDVAQGAMNAGGIGAAFSAALSKAEDLGRQAADIIANPSQANLMGTGRLAAYYARSSIESIAPGAGAALDIATGTAVNPHQALNFDGVNLKQFNFQWTLAPKSPAESAALKNIITEFKRNILPSYEGVGTTVGATALDRALLGYPNLVQVQLFGLSDDYEFKFKPGMISNFNVNYSGQGNVILAGGRPGIVTLNFTFQEAKIHTREDYNGVGGGISLGNPLAAGTGNEAQETVESLSQSAGQIESALGDIARGIQRGF